MPDMPVRYVGTCLCCGERSAGTDNPDDAQLWCLKHAGATGDTGYELSTHSCFDAAPSAASGAPAR
ncbi:hypothetical protein K9S39_25630 [Streptomyces halobius]|uniref:DUF7848 domain-containing protein n=1 Tax=Streptomyces halobius TaxID=2879846 RepID=A0ABY4MAJ1_9ACTN|nr:hypothetical protein [Streptomyces halobius]UQA94789.1 hypothetical protein K9S39_25630 [Streptomyces halobius]